MASRKPTRRKTCDFPSHDKKSQIYCKSIRNEREYQEDRYRVFWIRNYIVMAVCDGHGGSKAVNYVMHEMYNWFMHRKPTWKALHLDRLICKISNQWDRLCLRELDVGHYPKTKEERAKIFENKEDTYSRHGWSSGTTCVIVCICPELSEYNILNVGDSRAVWKMGKAQRVYRTKLHVPRKNDMGKFGGVIKKDEEGVKRVQEDLAVGRAIGDNTSLLMGTIKHQPDIYKGKFRKPFGVVIASDGLWDEMQPKEALTIFYPDKLITQAVKRGSTDNITVVSAHFV